VHGSGLDTAHASGPSTPANSDPNGDNVKSAVRNYAGFLDPTSNITVTYLDSSNDAPSRVQVTVTYPVVSFFSAWTTSLTINASAEGRIFY